MNGHGIEIVHKEIIREIASNRVMRYNNMHVYIVRNRVRSIYGIIMLYYCNELQQQ